MRNSYTKCFYHIQPLPQQIPQAIPNFRLVHIFEKTFGLKRKEEMILLPTIHIAIISHYDI